MVRFTDQSDGDLAIAGAPRDLAARRARIVDAPWTWLRQVHGARVVLVDAPGAHAGEEADAAVTNVEGAPLAIHTADCAPVLLSSPGVIGVAHAGWRGLAAGVIEATLAAMGELGAAPGRVQAEIGPCIRARCYEFSQQDLDTVAAAAGPEVRATTAWKTPALDVPAGVRAALGRSGVRSIADSGICTACSPNHWSYRAHGDTARQAAVAWLAA